MRRTADRWKSIVAGFEASGLTVAEYCHRRGVPVGSFVSVHETTCPATRCPGSGGA